MATRFRVVQAPEKRPGCCHSCRVTRPGPYLDAGEERLGGKIYFCPVCANELVRVWQKATVAEPLHEPQGEVDASSDAATCPKCGKTYTGRLAEHNLRRHVAKCTGEG